MSFVPAMRDYAQMLREDAPKMERERAESKGRRADRRSSARAANAAKWTQGAAIGCEKDPHLAAEIEWQADELSGRRNP